MDYIAALLIVLGIILTGKKNKYGWVLSALGSFMYLYLLQGTEYYGMMSLNAIMGGLSIKNFYVWNKSKKIKL